MPKYWESIRDKLKALGWEVKWVQEGSTFVAQASKKELKHLARAEELTVAFLELQKSCETRQ